MQVAYAPAPRPDQYELNENFLRWRGPTAMVKEFHDAFDAPDPATPQFPDAATFELRKRLIEEEYQEFLDAVAEGDLANAFKELADLIYVVAGTGAAFGGDLDAVFLAVHESNMSKLGEDGKPVKREDGKILKGPKYKAPNIAEVLGL